MSLYNMFIMEEFLRGIDNKEIFIEVLHHSVDYLIENRNDQHTIRMCHKYGFQNPDDFLLTTRSIANYFKNCIENSTTEIGLNEEFTGLNPDLHRLVPLILAARRPEIINYLLRRQSAQECTALEAFDWDTRLIMGDSSFSQNIRQLTTATMFCRNPNWKQHIIHFQMSKDKLCKFINALEDALDLQK